jgi:Zn-dependent M28 family amino/carboxypeptidase
MSSNNPFLSLDQRIIGDIYTHNEIMDNLVILCDDFGSRFGGTVGEQQAVTFAQKKLEAYGLENIRQEPVKYEGWTRGEAKLVITSPVEKEIPCISLPHSPPADLEGVIIDMGDGSPQAFEQRADEIKDKVVMTTSVVNPDSTGRWIHRGEKYGRSVLAGAKAFIFVNHYPAYGPATGGVGHAGEAGNIPGISISKEDGAFIQRLIQRKGQVQIRLKTSDHLEPATSWNIVGDLRGTDFPDEIIMLGCHYDGHDISQGAQDPASGAVAVLEAARVLAEYAPDLPRTVRFVLWGVEEIGLLGSRAYAAEHADELSNIRFYLNMDSAGGASNNRDIVLNEWPELASLFEQWSEEMALGFAVGQSVHAHSDHFPFFMAGVPTGGMQSVERSGEGRGYGHTQYDTVDKVDLRSLREAAALAARLALRLATEEQWPAARRDEQTVMKLLDSPDYQEEKAFRDRLDAFYAGVRSD